MALSVFDIFRIGIGPSSSHTMGPMHAARIFAKQLESRGSLKFTARIQAELFGSLGATGKGHGSPKAVLLGLMGEVPEGVELDSIAGKLRHIREEQTLYLLGQHAIEFVEQRDLLLHANQDLPYHPNGLKFTAYDNSDEVLIACCYYSVGGGFVVDEKGLPLNRTFEKNITPPYPFTTAAELLEMAKGAGLSISELMQKNEESWRSQKLIYTQLDTIHRAMEACIERGLVSKGIMPGGLKIERRAPLVYAQLKSSEHHMNHDGLAQLDWVSLYAMAVNEENACGGRVVTAPTNGAAGIIPAVLRYFLRNYNQQNYNQQNDNECNHDTEIKRDAQSARRFLLCAAAIGILYKENASISGAEVGCQGEVGSACSMAAGALAEVCGGSPEQVENAAEIAMEHNLGLTCDPVGGLVQVPCIERNAMAAVKAINAARLALRGDGRHFVSLDKVIQTMRETGEDMKDKYKETARGGLAAQLMPVNIIEC